MIGTKRVAITTGCRDRIDNLRKVLPTWKALKEVDHIIIVDWGSKIPLCETLQDFQDPRILIVRTDQPFWHNSKCHNLEFNLAGKLLCDVVLRLDNDVAVTHEFFKRHPLDEDCFYAVDCHSVPAELDDKRNLCGTVFVHTKHFQTINGYNERLTQYGFEDEDLYRRLNTSGLVWRRCNLDLLDHIPHDDKLRFENLRSAKHLQKVSGSLAPNQTIKDYLIAMSKHVALTQPWTTADQQTTWTIERDDLRHWHCSEKQKPCS